MSKRQADAITPLPTILAKVEAFHSKMNEISKFLDDHNAPKEIRIKPHEVPMEFYIDKAAIARLAYIATLKGFDSFVVLLGLSEPGKRKGPAKSSCGKVTGCFLGVDKDRNILPQHKKSFKNEYGALQGSIPGEDTWPPPVPPNPPMRHHKGAEIKNYFMLDCKEKELIDYLS